MFKFARVSYYMINLTDKEDAAQVMMLASKYNIAALHKVGIYEGMQQNELFCKGRWIDMLKFTKEISRTRATKK